MKVPSAFSISKLHLSGMETFNRIVPEGTIRSFLCGIMMSMTPGRSKSGISVQPRDLDILCGLYESRIMTRAHLAALYFDDKPEATKKRAQALLRAGYLAERTRQPNEPAILYLTKSGYDLIHERGLLSQYPQQDWRSFQKRVNVSDATIRHELAVQDIKAAFSTSIRQTEHLTLAEFSTWPKMYEFRTTRPVTENGWTNHKEVLMKPDSFIRIHEQEPDGGLSEHVLFLELDRGTETIQTVVNKAIGYREYYRSGGFAKKCGIKVEDYRQCPFRVLLVFQGKARSEKIQLLLKDSHLQLHSQVICILYKDCRMFINGFPIAS
tara:strand:- start:167 stop:1135 length:969 start_codon:yes stop_codon:yes gene_type:complete